MKLTSPNLRRHYALFFLFLCLISCRKNTLTTEEEQILAEQGFSISYVQDYYYKHLRAKIDEGEKEAKLAGNLIFSGKSTIKWKMAKRFTKGNLEMVEAPIRFSKARLTAYSFAGNPGTQQSGLAMLEASFSKIVIYRNEQGKVMSRIITFIPDRSFISKYGNNTGGNTIKHLQKNFTGYLEFRSLNQKSLFIYRRESDNKLKKVNLKQSSVAIISAKKRSMLAATSNSVVKTMSSNCPPVCDPVYEMECVEGAPNPETSNGYDIECTQIMVDNHCYEDPSCSDDGGGSGGEYDPCNGPYASEIPECGFSYDPCADYGNCPDPNDALNQLLVSCLDIQTQRWVDDLNNLNDRLDHDEAQCYADNLGMPFADLLSIFPSIYEAILDARATQGGSLASIDWEGVAGFVTDVAEAKQNILYCIVDKRIAFENDYYSSYAQLQQAYNSCYNSYSGH